MDQPLRPPKAERPSADRLADRLLDLGDAAGKFLDSWERWDSGEDASPFAYDRLRERALRLKQTLSRLGLKT
jgi:hypothetical protein